MDKDKKLVISFELMNTIVVTLLDLPAKTSRLLLNRIEKEVTPYPEQEIKSPDTQPAAPDVVKLEDIAPPPVPRDGLV